ncbi:MAG TPA: hypothetical protein VFF87_04275, partial [Hyphomicrobium sp.]|nr:hypothetical protein [Hyphomicrobium sp.]
MSGALAVLLFVESQHASMSLIARASYRKTGAHFSGSTSLPVLLIGNRCPLFRKHGPYQSDAWIIGPIKKRAHAFIQKKKPARGAGFFRETGLCGCRTDARGVPQTLLTYQLRGAVMGLLSSSIIGTPYSRSTL